MTLGACRIANLLSVQKIQGLKLWATSVKKGSSLHHPPLMLRNTRARAVRNVLNVYLISLTKNLWHEERQQLDSGGGGALSQGAGHDGSFFDSIIPGKFICCLAGEMR